MKENKIYLVIISDVNESGLNTTAYPYKSREEAENFYNTQYLAHSGSFKDKYGEDGSNCENYDWSFSVWEDSDYLANHINGRIVEIDVNNLPNHITLWDEAF